MLGKGSELMITTVSSHIITGTIRASYIAMVRAGQMIRLNLRTVRVRMGYP